MSEEALPFLERTTNLCIQYKLREKNLKVFTLFTSLLLPKIRGTDKVKIWSARRATELRSNVRQTPAIRPDFENYQRKHGN